MSFFFFTFCISTAAFLGIFRCPFSTELPDFHFQDFGRRVEENMAVSLIKARRILSGPGSSPPRCTSKCGNCTPCKPVHVPVPPGTPVTAEYYPEAWRCKCGNKLYMP
ncbi:EPIDERMAL PATTERNING FACTOR-like protein 6 [Euphorbia peplus]|nr:EPIDERMAL PATTERNING FACTOR-like protein 6 [Euphorbia peplus]